MRLSFADARPVFLFCTRWETRAIDGMNLGAIRDYEVVLLHHRFGYLSPPKNHGQIIWAKSPSVLIFLSQCVIAPFGTKIF